MASAKHKPSDQLKARLRAELLSEVDSMGKMAHRLCESSQSQQVRSRGPPVNGEGFTSARGGVTRTDRFQSNVRSGCYAHVAMFFGL